MVFTGVGGVVDKVCCFVIIVVVAVCSVICVDAWDDAIVDCLGVTVIVVDGVVVCCVVVVVVDVVLCCIVVVFADGVVVCCVVVVVADGVVVCCVVVVGIVVVFCAVVDFEIASVDVVPEVVLQLCSYLGVVGSCEGVVKVGPS